MSHKPGPWVAQQDCRSYRNEGIFDGSNPDRYGNPNKWGIYAEHFRIATLEESSDWLSQEQVDANAVLLALAPELLGACKSALRALEDNLEPGPMDEDAKIALHIVIEKAGG